MIDRNLDSHVIPSELLAQIQEYCLGGFMLFCFDEDGNPHVISNPESPVVLLAFKDSIAMWLKTMKDVMEEGLSDSFIEGIVEEIIDEEMNGEDEEDDDNEGWKKEDPSDNDNPSDKGEGE